MSKERSKWIGKRCKGRSKEMDKEGVRSNEKEGVRSKDETNVNNQ